MREPHVHAHVDEFAQVSPVFEIAGAAIDFVDDDAGGVAALQLGEQPTKHLSTEFCRRLHLFVPAGDGKIISRGIRFDRAPLFLE